MHDSSCNLRLNQLRHLSLRFIKVVDQHNTKSFRPSQDLIRLPISEYLRSTSKYFTRTHLAGVYFLSMTQEVRKVKEICLDRHSHTISIVKVKETYIKPGLYLFLNYCFPVPFSDSVYNTRILKIFLLESWYTKELWTLSVFSH